ncbi:hypothetical protein A4A49_65124, partial [Nicotiana attenuata]
QNDNGNQIATGEIKYTPKSTATGKYDVVKQQQQQAGHTVGKLNPTAPEFNINSAGVGSTNGGTETKLHRYNESTAEWVQRAFLGTTGENIVGINTSYQEIPSQDTLVDMELGNNPEIQTKEKFLSKVNERVQWSGGKLWSDQREIDPEENDVPAGAQHDEEPVHEDKEEEEKNVNGEASVAISNKEDAAATKEKNDAVEKLATKEPQEENSSQVNPAEGVGTGAVDPGGT